MNGLEKNIMRKLSIRKKARENMGLLPQTLDEPAAAQFGIEQVEQAELERLYTHLAENLAEADQFKTQTGYWQIYSSRKIIGKLIVFLKKCMRKLLKIFLGWYVFPIYQRQSTFNGKILNSAELLRTISSQKNQLIERQQEQINQLRNELAESNAQNTRLIAAQQGQIALLRSEMAEPNAQNAKLAAEQQEQINQLRNELIETNDLNAKLTAEQQEKINQLRNELIETNALNAKLTAEQLKQTNQLCNELTETNVQNAKLTAEQQKQTNQLCNELTESNAQNANLFAELSKKISYLMSKHNLPDDLSLMRNVLPIDYFDFENHFRGSRTGVKELQRYYVDYYKINGGGEILDIGCGRGEFLELMFDYGFPARGIDLYMPFVDYCRDRGFLVEQADALTYLNSLNDTVLGGIFMSQVVEHLDSDYLRALIEIAYRKMKPGCYFILETPNPDCVAAITEFSIDPSHVKPVHYKSLEYFFIKAGYTKVERYHKPECLYPLQMMKIIGSHAENENEFNDGIANANNMLFGFRDYALIAMK